MSDMCGRRLPAVEVKAACSFVAPDGESNQPEHGEDDSDNPEQMNHEAEAEEQKDEQQGKCEERAEMRIAEWLRFDSPGDLVCIV